MDYGYLRLLHLFAVVVFLGNIITELAWMRRAVKTLDKQTIAFILDGIVKGDRLFTIPGVIVIVASGVWASIMGGYSTLNTPWILWSVVLFVISGVAFSARVGPLQKKMLKLLRETDTFEPRQVKIFKKIYASWNLWGWIALITPLIAFVMMTLKIPR